MIPQHLSESNEHYTPTEIIDKARLVMGSIDLDPASCLLANSIVKADNFYSKEKDGLTEQWFGNVFLNPPGGKTNNKSNQALWLKTAVQKYLDREINQLFFVSFNIESMRTCGNLLNEVMICVPKKRIRYLSEYSEGVLKEGNWSKKGKWSNSPPNASGFFYWGQHRKQFTKVFNEIGCVWELRKPLYYD
jgi:ParB family chromosome partitioning protein